VTGALEFGLPVAHQDGTEVADNTGIFMLMAMN